MTNPNDEQQVPGAEQDEDDNILIESTLVLDFLDQSGVTERLNRPGTTDVAINRPLEMWVDTPHGLAAGGRALVDLQPVLEIGQQPGRA